MSRATWAVVAVLGGGHLGRLLAEAGRHLGIECRLFVPAERMVAPVITTSWPDGEALRCLADNATVATWEIEHVPVQTVERLARLVPVRPSPAVLAAVQDRMHQKRLLDGLGIATAPWSAPSTLDACREALARLGLPLVAKARRGCYDGRGQRVLRQEGDLETAWLEHGPDGLLLERFVSSTDECSLLSVRGPDGEIRHWPVVENRHRDGVLATTVAPHPAWSPVLQARAEAIATALLRHLRYVGVLAVEMYRCGELLLVNELSPRVHNTGHWTIEGAASSQFENHLRAVLGWPLGDTAAQGFSAMINCLGAMPGRQAVDGPGVHRHDYGMPPRPGRKVGHVTVVGSSTAERDARLAALQQRMAASIRPSASMQA